MYHGRKSGRVSNITSQPGGAVYLTDLEATNVNRIFSSRLSYNKAAMVLHMLRWKMGDTAFYQALKNYLADTNLAFKYAITTDLKAHLEAVHGSSLTEFFNDWVYNQGYPTYLVNAQNINSTQTQITINQVQSHSSVSFFEMPIQIRLVGAAGQTHDVLLEHTFNGQQFVVNVPFSPVSILFDPNVHLISKNNTATLQNTIFETTNAFLLLPNPAKENVTIYLNEGNQLLQVELFNVFGQKVFETSTVSFNISSLQSGVYLARIKTTEGMLHKNIIKN